MQAIIRLPNLLSISRIFFAFFFLSSNIYLRLFAVSLAALSDFFDGYLARRWNSQSKLGSLLDPIGDKCFAFFAIMVLYLENTLSLPQIACLLSRDIALILFFSYLYFSNAWQKYTIKAFWSGKITTTLQFLAFIFAVLNIQAPELLYSSLALLGVSSLIELYLRP